MNTEKPPLIRRGDYTAPPFLVDRVDLDFHFRSAGVIVASRLRMRRNPAVAAEQVLRLDGSGLETLSISVNGKALSEDYERTETTLCLLHPPAEFLLETLVRIDPDHNTGLSGLYRSQDGYFTQCEAEGFRQITWFPDRPDVMARYTVTLHADQCKLPVLLANGNLIAHGEEDGGRHWARWEDPFPKPSYLFAVVAARLDVRRDVYLSGSGRQVHLAVYVEPGKLDQTAHAMDALKRAMRWDEDVFGLECDLDHYMIVAVGDFNMGAMENKGLNIFNTKYVLARADTATDTDYQNIDRVVAHEYFHNWTGNRVTCRDWFQLSLKEGLTVFRDQEFGADQHGRAVTRIREVRDLRAAQFPEDASPMAHPVRPDSYVEINNFYTSTVYEKGAELVRMIQTLIGKAAFRSGMDLYFTRHDGQAVTCDEFVAAMADASGTDLTQFMRWYDQAGTPRLGAHGRYDADHRRYVLTLTQSPWRERAQESDLPLLIPVEIGLLAASGDELPLVLAGEPSDVPCPTARVLSLSAARQSFVFENVPVEPVVSLLRNFSAPVLVEGEWRTEDLLLQFAHDTDPFNRWEAGQRLASRLILAAAGNLSTGTPPHWPQHFADALTQLLTQHSQDPAFAAEALQLPGEATLAEAMPVVDPDALHEARNGLRQFIAGRLAGIFQETYANLAPQGPYHPSPAEVGRRALRNVCLGYLAELPSGEGIQLAMRQFGWSDNMTDQYAALSILAQHDCPEREQALAAFHARWHHEALVVDKWLAVQATSRLPGTLATVRDLLGQSTFDLNNPNKVYALLGAFGRNHVRFHGADGAGYHFLAEQIAALDRINPQVAARLARCFDRWRRFDPIRRTHAQAALERLRALADVSADVLEIVSRALA